MDRKERGIIIFAIIIGVLAFGVYGFVDTFVKDIYPEKEVQLAPYNTPFVGLNCEWIRMLYCKRCHDPCSNHWLPDGTLLGCRQRDGSEEGCSVSVFKSRQVPLHAPFSEIERIAMGFYNDETGEWQVGFCETEPYYGVYFSVGHVRSCSGGSVSR